MVKNILFLSFFFVAILSNSQEIEQIRSQYPLAEKSEEITLQLDETLSPVTSEDKSILLAYQGAVKTLKARFAKRIREKKEYFKDGVELIESAIDSNPENIEIRYLRLTVQENSPRFLGYHKNIIDDKEFILKNYSTIISQSIKAVIKDFVRESENFDETEKRLTD